MKCILLAGGRGDRMWPLSRKNYPKQFIKIKNNHSIFQETIARNMAFCDEFIIVTNKDFQSIIENQMKAFRGVTYRCIFEEIGKGTAPAVILSGLQIPDSELIFVVASDQLINGKEYKNAVLEAKALAKKGYLVSFGTDIDIPETRFGYIGYEDNAVTEFVENPSSLQALAFKSSGNYFVNSGLFMFRNGEFGLKLSEVNPTLKENCLRAYSNKKTNGNYTYYDRNAFEEIEHSSLESVFFADTDVCRVVKCEFEFQDVGGLDDLEKLALRDVIGRNKSKRGDTSVEPIIENKCKNTTVINRCDDKLVLVNHLDDVLVVNTDDAIYIGKKGQSNDLKDIILQRKELWDYFEKSALFYRKWGSYEILEEDRDNAFYVRKVTVLPGKTIYFHKHAKKCEHLTIVSGRAKVFIGDESAFYNAGDVISIDEGMIHQISCVSDEPLAFIETSTQVEFKKEDIIDVQSRDLSEGSLGYSYDKFVLLSPAYKDYLWGGNRLKKQFGKKCDFDSVAESWELSAHPDGQSLVASGKYEGLLFADYINHIGDDALGWKYQGMRNFPLMIKLIDAKKNLSVQVHPGDDYALEHENEYGKSELWYIIDCNEDSYIYCGFNRDVSREEVQEALKNGTIEELLNKVYVKPGETYYIEAGTVHAIGKGCLICEIQQNSNSTYRLYDYDRVDKYGQKRKLDIEKALDVLNYKSYVPNGECKYFSVKVRKCRNRSKLVLSEESFCAIVILDGSGEISDKDNSLAFEKGNCVFIPRINANFELKGVFDYVEVRI